MSNTLKLGNGNWATKEDSLLAYNDENGNFKPLPFDFTRASSATVVNKQGLIETVGSGEPRIDFGSDSKGALLLEPQSTNVIDYSEAFNNSDWIKGNSSIDSNLLISPDNSQNASSLIEDTSSSIHETINVNTVVSGSNYSFSVFVKSGLRTKCSLVLAGAAFSGGGNGSAIYNLSDSNIISNSGGVTSSIEDYGNGWLKCSISKIASNTSCVVAISLIDESNNTSYLGDGVSNIYLYGAQLEEQSYATSYIPTQGSAVTRVADACNNAGNEQVINSTEGVLYAEISALDDDETQRFISLSDGTTTNRLILGFDNSSNRIISFARVGGALSFDIKETISNIQSYNKIAIKWKENDFALWANGVELGVDTSGASFTSNVLNALKFSDADGTTEIFNGNAKDVRVYNTALTDQELINLTTI